MAQTEQQENAKAFAENWKGKGDEKQETSRFWMQLLGEVLDVKSPASYIEFEKRVKLSHTSFIDAYIPETKVLIEQKGIKIDLDKPQEQSDGTVLTPYQQAKRYSDELPLRLKPRWIVVSNFEQIHVHDMDRPDSPPEVIYLKDLEKDFYRLEFLVDRKNENIRREEEISLAAGKLVGRMYDALVKEYINPESAESARSLNILCVRLVFCFYAEDAGLFEARTSFEDYIRSFAVENVRGGLIALFKALDTKLESRDKYDLKLKPFPYVNGGLFHDENIEIPNFTQEIVDVLVSECAVFNWSDISPTIFGAVFESTLNPATRRKGGMHYTSIENIHRLIDPLFLDGLSAELDEIMGISGQMKAGQGRQRAAALYAFQQKLGSLTFLDPACGSGNFLTETYLSLRRLENKVISALNKGEKALGFDEFIHVKISQFYGIEINDFAVTVAKTALWIAESQMINETERILGQQIDFLPLKTNAYIVEGNALRMDWATLRPLDGDEMPADGLFAGITTHVDGRTHHYDFIMGNPPFVGHQWRTKEQQADMDFVYSDFDSNYGKLDYVCSWYKKALDLIKDTDTKCAFVSTNSICQGESVATMWKPLFSHGLQIDFAYRTFRWDSESTEKAHVHCVIIGFSCKNKEECHTDSISLTRNQEKADLKSANGKSLDFPNPCGNKFIIDENGEKHIAQNINGYLLDAPNVFIENRGSPLTKELSKMSKGSQPTDGGNLILSEEERAELISKYPAADSFVKRYISADDYINNKKRYCLWLKDVSPNEYRKIPPVMERLKKVAEMRSKSPTASVKRDAEIPMLFTQIRQPKTDYLVVPEVSSEKRKYVPIGFMPKDIIVSNMIYAVPNATLYLFGVLISSVHMAWMRAVCGRLEMRYRYTPAVYNNFPWPKTTDEQKSKIEKTAQAILDARAKFPDASLADLYDSLSMPPELRKAHEANDRAVMQAYGFNAKMTEAEIVAELLVRFKI